MRNLIRNTKREMKNKAKKYDATQATVTRCNQRSIKTRLSDDQDTSSIDDDIYMHNPPKVLNYFGCHVKLSVVDIHSHRSRRLEANGAKSMVSNIEEIVDLKLDTIDIRVEPEIEEVGIKPNIEDLVDIIPENEELLVIKPEIGDLLDLNPDIKESVNLNGKPDVEEFVDIKPAKESKVDLNYENDADATLVNKNAVEIAGSLDPFIKPITYINPFKKLEAEVIPHTQPVIDMNFDIKPNEVLLDDSKSNISKTFELLVASLVNYDVIQHSEYNQCNKTLTNHSQYDIINRSMTDDIDQDNNTNQELSFSTPDFTGFQYHTDLKVDMSASADHRQSLQSIELNCNENGSVPNQEETTLDKCESIRKEKKHVCNICSKKFYLSCKLDAHKLIKHHKRIYDCLTCSKSFEMRLDLQRHIKNHDKARMMKCFHFRCDKTFPSRKLMQEHCQTSHRPAKGLGCRKW